MLEHRRYGSKHAALRVNPQGPDPILHPVTGSIIGHKRELTAEFGVLGAEYIARDTDGEPLYHNSDGSPYVSADIRGHFWDSKHAQEQNGWTDEETEAVIAAVEYECKRQPELVWRLEEPRFARPWPTFDSQDAKNIVMFAIEGGLVAEALAYEKQNQNRAGVVKELKAHLSEKVSEAQAEASLTV